MQYWQPGLQLWCGWDKWTRDGVIPWRLFWAIYDRVDRIMAMQQLAQLDATVKALAVAFADRKKSADVDDIPEELRRKAFPYLFDEL